MRCLLYSSARVLAQNISGCRLYSSLPKVTARVLVQNCSEQLWNREYLPGKPEAKRKVGIFMTPQPRDWHELAQKASKEMDPEKLEQLIDELNRTLERDERRRRQEAA